jgi:hypothetical protein
MIVIVVLVHLFYNLFLRSFSFNIGTREIFDNETSDRICGFVPVMRAP